MAPPSLIPNFDELRPLNLKEVIEIYSDSLDFEMIEKRSFLEVIDELYRDAHLIIKYQKVLRILKPGQLAGLRDLLREVVATLDVLANGVEEQLEEGAQAEGATSDLSGVI